MHQVDNVALAVPERRKLDRKEKAELEQAGRGMWANLRPGYEWLQGLGVRVAGRVAGGPFRAAIGAWTSGAWARVGLIRDWLASPLACPSRKASRCPPGA